MKQKDHEHFLTQFPGLGGHFGVEKAAANRLPFAKHVIEAIERLNASMSCTLAELGMNPTVDDFVMATRGDAEMDQLAFRKIPSRPSKEIRKSR